MSDYCCGYPKCKKPSVVTLINVPLCSEHWLTRCTVEGDKEKAYLSKIGLMINEENETVPKPK